MNTLLLAILVNSSLGATVPGFLAENTRLCMFDEYGGSEVVVSFEECLELDMDAQIYFKNIAILTKYTTTTESIMHY